MRLIITLVRAPFWLLSRVLGLVLGFAVFALLALSIVAFGPFLTLGYGLKYGIRFPVTLRGLLLHHMLSVGSGAMY